MRSAVVTEIRSLFTVSLLLSGLLLLGSCELEPEDELSPEQETLAGWTEASVAFAKGRRAAFDAAMSAVEMGPGTAPGVALGPLINRSAQDTMTETIEISTGAGSAVRVGGTAPDAPGFFFEPTVLTGVDRGDPILRREIFGPIAPISTFASDEEAVALANDTIHGLAAYVYSQDLARAMRASEAIETGMVGINRGFYSDPAAPFGGVKQSGIGREGSREGMMEFLETKYIAVDW